MKVYFLGKLFAIHENLEKQLQYENLLRLALETKKLGNNRVLWYNKKI
jgi:hypothetical protein